MCVRNEELEKKSNFPVQQHFSGVVNYKDNKIKLCILCYDKDRPFSLWCRTF